MITGFSLSDALAAIGRAVVFSGDPLTAGGLTPIGALEGGVEVNEQESYNDLTAPEWTGGSIHSREVMQESALVTLPLIVGTAAQYARLSSIGIGTGGGYSSPQPAVPTGLLVIPFSELTSARTISFDGTTWNPATPPVHAVWIWKAVPETSARTFTRDGKGKMVRTITFRALFDDAKPEGMKLWARGNPSPSVAVRL